VTPVDTRPVALLLYKRKSNDPEGRQVSVERQDGLLREWAEQDYPDAHLLDGVSPDHPLGYCDNDTSASTLSDDERPEYDRILADARAATESGQYSRVLLAAYSDSRLTRRPRENEDLIDLAKHFGVEYHYLRSPKFDLNTADGREYARAAVARNAGEAERTGERILDAKIDQAMDGIWSGGGRPFGYRMEYDYNANGLPIKPGRLVLDETEAEAIRDGVAAFLAGASLGAIGTMWMDRGHTTSAGNAWLPTNVRRVLERGRNAGLSERHGEWMGAGQWPTIITEDELAAVRAKLADPSRKKYDGEYGRKWLGARLYRCGQPGCESDMRSTGGGGRQADSRYRCRQAGHCVINAPEVDAHVRDRVAAYLARHGRGLLAGTQDAERDRLTLQATAIRGKLDALALAFATDATDDPGRAARALAMATRTLDKQLEEIEAARTLLVVPQTTLTGIADTEDPARAFLNAPLERQRAVLDVLVTVTILPGKRGRNIPVDDRVVITPRRDLSS
jgi:DNA invertase Pin-like site-specific DNA recombinase